MIRRSLVRAGLIAATRLLVGGHPRWIGTQESTRQRIYFANHGSHLDTILLWAALSPPLRETTHPVAAADYWSRTPLRRFVALDVLNAVLIQRAGPDRRGDPLRPLTEALSAGRSLILFPEGTRGSEPLPGPFKPGLHHLAMAFPTVELIPVHLDNLARAFPKGAILPAPIGCTVRFGAALERRLDEDRAAFLERARAAVVALAAPTPA